MKERPILFSAPMVRALLDSSKTQTRLIAKEFDGKGDLDAILRRFPNQHGCPYGEPGDRLWVREAHSFVPDGDDPSGCSQVLYAADGQQYGKLRPCIHMPRWASRILLEITGVRVERLQDISEADCLAEGVHAIRHEGDGTYYHYEHTHADPGNWCDADTAYQHLWESINGAGSWDANPWVWVVEFTRVTP